MKRLIIFYALILAACSTSTDWDRGADRQDSYQQQRMEEHTEDVRNQNPEIINPFRYQSF